MLRLLEHYTSTQGEGPRVGQLTQFVRFAGCNLKCPSWPCDTQFAIDPALYRAEQQQVSALEVAERIRVEQVANGATNICLTGGEPFLQRAADLTLLVKELFGGYFTFEVFTNGTMPLHAAMLDMQVAPVLDWKLPGSGEDYADMTRMRNITVMRNRKLGAIKFTVADEEDFNLARALWQKHNGDNLLETFVGPVWGKVEPEQVVKWMMKYQLPWRLNIQSHNYIYGAQVRGT